MKSGYSVLLLLPVVCLAVSAPAFAAKAKSGQPSKQVHKLGSIGTSQLPGDWCQFDKAYSLGVLKGGNANALNVAVKSAEYTIVPVKVGNSIFVPDAGQKLMVIHYTLQNPLPIEQKVQYDSITWTAVDAKSQNRRQEYLGVGVDDKTQNALAQNLKPGQKINVYAVFKVDAYGPVPKLMAARYEVPSPVARYDLKGKVKGLESPYADPSDATGATMLKKIPGVIGTSYVTGDWDTKVEKIEFVKPPLSDEGYNNGDEYVIATLECKYYGPEAAGGIGGSDSPTSGMKLVDADGVTYDRTYGIMTPSSNRTFGPKAEQGESTRFRVPFSVPKGIQLKSLILQEYGLTPVVVDLSSYKVPEDN